MNWNASVTVQYNPKAEHGMNANCQILCNFKWCDMFIIVHETEKNHSMRSLRTVITTTRTLMNGLFFRIYLTTSRTSRKLFRLLTMQTDFEHFMSDVLQASKKTGSVHKTDSFEI